jgi:hypothetical protein
MVLLIIIIVVDVVVVWRPDSLVGIMNFLRGG